MKKLITFFWVDKTFLKKCDKKGTNEEANSIF